MVTRHAFTVEEYHAMADAGIFNEDSRVELLDGEVLEMTPIGPPHAVCVNQLNYLLVHAVSDRAVVQIQGPIVLDDRSEPQPDVALLVPPAGRYRKQHAGPTEVLLAIEVSDTTLAFDRDIKAPRYMQAGIAEAWVVDLAAETVLVFRGPDVTVVTRGQTVAVADLGVTLAVDEILG